MKLRVVCDASTILAALLDSGDDGRWAAAKISEGDLYAPTLLPFECANVMRRQELAGRISTDEAGQAHTDLLDLAIDYWPYDLLADRIWELRQNLSSYDAAYVALAETLDATVVTLDRRIGGAPRLRCEIDTPPGPTRPR
ncbi:type II toxin-antitoxin system VapC family toxin [Mycolicibacterium sp. GF69]|uniref:type II toxin-antitoxin system VapC family toxin n=1 Tax=Mycolicibacterium sp. GF69 TaxID=2267251 RepID=UPI00197B6E1F|nr:type II toxin-antitoxin system VapC family toxin [Mycolicibacterium sp. GF69]